MYKKFLIYCFLIGYAMIVKGDNDMDMKPNESLVGIAYQCWFQSKDWQPFWTEPELGTYASNDLNVIRQHAAWLTDAGVDFIWIDWSNNVNYDPVTIGKDRMDFYTIEYTTKLIFDEYPKLPKAPKISIFIGCPDQGSAVEDGKLQQKADQVWDWFASKPEYRSQMIELYGKPLLAIYLGTPSFAQEGPPNWDDPRFTVRWFTGYVKEQPALINPDLTSKYGFWSWEERGIQPYPVYNGRPESMVVVAAWRPHGTPEEEGYIPSDGRRNGETFKDQWERATEVAPRIVIVQSWNEWVLGEEPTPDISNDIEPSKLYGHFYLDLMKEEIAKYKASLSQRQRFVQFLYRNVNLNLSRSGLL